MDTTEAHEVLNHLAETAKNLLESDGYAQPFAFMFVRRNPQTGAACAPTLCPIPMSEFSGKDQAAEFLRRFAQKLDAVAVVMVMESWVVYLPIESEADEAVLRQAEVDGIEAHPDRREVLMVYLEHRDMPGQTWLSGDIVRDADGKPSVSPFVTLNNGLHASATLDGRFVRILPQNPLDVN